MKVKEGQMDWEKFHEDVPLKVWNCSAHTIQAKIEKLLHKAAAIKEESKLMSAVYQWLSGDDTNANTPAFGNLTTVDSLAA